MLGVSALPKAPGDSAPEGSRGLVVVSLPDLGKWQGFHVTDAWRKDGETMLARVREASAAAAPTEVDSALPSVAEADQPTVGALASVLARLFEMGTATPQPRGAQAQAIMDGTAAAVWALNAVTSERWLLVTARPGEQGGYRTTVGRYDAADAAEARSLILADVERGRTASRAADDFMEMVRQAEAHRQKG